MLKPQDVFVLLKVLVKNGNDWTYRSLAEELEMSVSEVHDALKRADHAGLYNSDARRVKTSPFLQFLEGGLRFVYYTEVGPIKRGIPTAHSAPPLDDIFPEGEEEHTFVWPDPEGTKRGSSVEPLYPSVPAAAKKDPDLYEWLNLLESIRVGRPRERKEALEECKRRLEFS